MCIQETDANGTRTKETNDCYGGVLEADVTAELMVLSEDTLSADASPQKVLLWY